MILHSFLLQKSPGASFMRKPRMKPYGDFSVHTLCWERRGRGGGVEIQSRQKPAGEVNFLSESVKGELERKTHTKQPRRVTVLPREKCNLDKLEVLIKPRGFSCDRAQDQRRCRRRRMKRKRGMTRLTSLTNTEPRHGQETCLLSLVKAYLG